MPVSTRVIRRRIKSVTNTRKITSAMELVAAAKMRKATAAALSSRPYAGGAWDAVRAVTRAAAPDVHPLLRRHAGSPAPALVVLFTSDRGLCGGYNARALKAFFDRNAQLAVADVVTIGRRGEQALIRAGLAPVASFHDLGDRPSPTSVRPLARFAINGFVSEKYSRVLVVSTHYKSALTQLPYVTELLPLHEENSAEEKHGASPEYLFEPSPREVLDLVLPRIVESQLYQALLEATASEHAARMLAMRSASDAAADMIDDLSLTYNQSRQAGITREIAEISSGAAALSA